MGVKGKGLFMLICIVIMGEMYGFELLFVIEVFGCEKVFNCLDIWLKNN